VTALLHRRSRPLVVEDRAADGQRRKHVTDELGNTVTEWARADRQDVTVRPPTIKLVVASPPDVRRELRREALLRRRSLRWVASDVWRHALRHDLVDISRIANRRGPRA
jgi:hypothetical protein